MQDNQHENKLLPATEQVTIILLYILSTYFCSINTNKLLG